MHRAGSPFPRRDSITCLAKFYDMLMIDLINKMLLNIQLSIKNQFSLINDFHYDDRLMLSIFELLHFL